MQDQNKTPFQLSTLFVQYQLDIKQTTAYNNHPSKVTMASAKNKDENDQFDEFDSENVKKLTNLGSIKGFEAVIKEFIDKFISSGHPVVDMVLKQFTSTKLTAEKNAATASKLRNQANKQFTKCKSLGKGTEGFVKVLKMYNESIAFAPNNSQELALAYGNRALVLLQCQYYNECLVDINRAVCLDYPDESLCKLLVKKIRCMKILNHPDLQATYNDCFKWIDKLDNSTNKRQMKEEIKSAYETKVTETCLVPIDTQFQDDLLEHMKKECPNLEKVQVGRNSSGELTLVAAKDIQVNEVIALEKMYTQICHITEPYLACMQCVMMCLNPIPCDGCTTATYCSEACKAEAWIKHHQFECQILPLIKELMPDLMLPIRICVTAMKQLGGILPLMKEVIKMSKTTDIKKEHSIVDGVYPSDSYKSVYYMMNKLPVEEAELSINILKVTTFIHYLATRTTFFGQQSKKEFQVVMQERQHKFFAALILRHFIMLQRLQRMEWWQPYKVLMSSTPVFPLFHNLKHSCNPNSVKFMLKDHSILVAIDMIKKGQEINFSLHEKILIGIKKNERQPIIENVCKGPCKCEMCMKQFQDLTQYAELVTDVTEVKRILVTNAQIMMAVTEYQRRKPKTAAEFVQRTEDLCKKFFRPFIAKAPSLCKDVICYKNQLMRAYSEVSHRGMYSFIGCEDPA